MTYLTAVDPVALSALVFGHSHWEVPQEILRAVFQPSSRVAVKSCHASSKTFTAADALLLALLLGGDVLVTAPTWLQVEQVLFGQVHAAIAASQIPLAEWGQVNRTEIRLPTGEFALGISTDQAVRFQGHHARPGSFLLIIMDEAPGVRPDIYEAVEGISAGGDVRLLLLGNPVVASGPFYDIFASESPRWGRFTIDAFDTPNLRGLSLADLLAMPDADVALSDRPYLVTRSWVRDRYHEWRTDHPLWQSRVRGQFPLQADDALLSLAWLEAAARRPVAYDPTQPVQAGVDVAGPGEDETVLCIRQGDAILELLAFPQADARGAVLADLQRYPTLEAVNVDTAGIGWYFAESLADADLPVVRINVGEAPSGRSARDTERAKAKFANLRGQVFWSFREWAQSGLLAGLSDRATLGQLAGLRYEHDHRGRIAIERKSDALKRGVKSPDRAEAVVLAFWQQPRSLLGAALGAALSQPNPATPSQTQLHPAKPSVADDAAFKAMLARVGVEVSGG